MESGASQTGSSGPGAFAASCGARMAAISASVRLWGCCTTRNQCQLALISNPRISFESDDCPPARPKRLSSSTCGYLPGMTDENIPPVEPTPDAVLPVPDDTLVERPVSRVVREEVIVPPADAVSAGAVHEEVRVGVLSDGSVVREYDRVEQPPVVEQRNWWPWLVSGLLLLVLIGLGIWYFTRDEKATVSSVVGQPVGSAVTRLEQDGFKTSVTHRAGGTRAGIVLVEQPPGGSSADKGSVVALTVSSAPVAVTVPNAVGVPQGDARDRLVAAGFSVTSANVNSDQPTGTVVAQAPAAGVKASRGTTVRINVSKGSATANVPSEVGQPVDAAQSDLAAKGFKPSVVQVPSDQPVGTVVAQSPSGGQSRKGSSVQLNVSKGPNATTTAPQTVTVPASTTQTTTSSGGSTTTAP
jgi:beta-lactam-binding protein with PASTA domain